MRMERRSGFHEFGLLGGFDAIRERNGRSTWIVVRKPVGGVLLVIRPFGVGVLRELSR